LHAVGRQGARDEGGRAGGAVSLGLQEEVTGYDGRGVGLACFDEPVYGISRPTEPSCRLGSWRRSRPSATIPVSRPAGSIGVFAFRLMLAELAMSFHGQTPATVYGRRAWERLARLTRTQRDSVGEIQNPVALTRLPLPARTNGGQKAPFALAALEKPPVSGHSSRMPSPIWSASAT
jgi:hypothetical protein